MPRNDAQKATLPERWFQGYTPRLTSRPLPVGTLGKSGEASGDTRGKVGAAIGTDDNPPRRYGG